MTNKVPGCCWHLSFHLLFIRANTQTKQPNTVLIGTCKILGHSHEANIGTTDQCINIFVKVTNISPSSIRLVTIIIMVGESGRCSKRWNEKRSEFVIWNLNLGRRLFLYFNYLVNVIAGGKRVPEGTCSQIYGQLQLIRSVLRALKISEMKNDWNCNIVGLLHHPFWLHLILALLGIAFLHFKQLCLAKDHWWRFNSRNVHMVHIVNYIRFGKVFASG